MTPASDTDRHDRQIRAFGSDGQRRLGAATAAVVGAGGIGSLLIQGLAHLGVGRLIVIDPDRVEPSNLNRLAGATAADARDGVSKAEVAARAVAGIAPLRSPSTLCRTAS
jgi:molybdopterin/thiamine biosynthesis adenylyltransferase